MTRDEFEQKLEEYENASYEWYEFGKGDYNECKAALLAEFDRLTAELAEAQENVQAFGKIIIAEVVERD